MTKPNDLADSLGVLAICLPGVPLRANVSSRGNRWQHEPVIAETRGAAHMLALSRLRERPNLRDIADAAALRVVAFETYPTGAKRADVAACAPAVKAAIDGIVAALDGAEPTRGYVRDDEQRVPEVVFLAGIETGAAGMVVAVSQWMLSGHTQTRLLQSAIIYGGTR